MGADHGSQNEMICLEYDLKRLYSYLKKQKTSLLEDDHFYRVGYWP